MPDIINVSVENKIATKTDDTEYVCCNPVYNALAELVGLYVEKV